jgi:KDO2-lipid IV(A) lauroyltransferase
MKFDLQAFTSSRLGIAVALGIGRFVPPKIGYRLTDLIARWLASRKQSPMVQAVRANQWMVSENGLTSRQLDDIVLKTFQHQTKCLYMYYRHLYDPTTSEDLIEILPRLAEIIRKTKDNHDPAVVVGIHMSNFDLIAYSAAQHGLHALGLALGDPSRGHQWQYEIRQGYGFDVVPANIATIRQAEKRLRGGGTVLTGIDRPLLQSKYHPKFFGQTAALPVIHIHLAMRTNAPVIVIAPIMGSDGIFSVLASDPIQMETHSDKKTAITKNAEKVLNVAEKFIRQAPYQWVMFYPVWPKAIEQMP